MLDPKKINEVVHQVMESLPEGVRNLPKDFQANFRSALTAAFAKLDLVTREEFDAQTAVLLRTREKLEELEKQIKALEAREK